jgi:hypothetical protein
MNWYINQFFEEKGEPSRRVVTIHTVFLAARWNALWLSLSP